MGIENKYINTSLFEMQIHIEQLPLHVVAVLDTIHLSTRSLDLLSPSL